MAPSGVACGDASIGELQWLAVEEADNPANRPDEPGAGKAGPSHGLRPVKVVEDARKNIRKDVFSGTAAFDVLGSQVFALGSLQEVDFVESDALLLGEAHGGPCRRADYVVGH